MGSPRCALLVALGCTPDQNFGHEVEHQDYAANIVVSPTELDFGPLDAGDSASLTLTVENTGDATLWVDPPTVESSGAFAVEGWPEEISLAPGEQREAVITYTSRRQDDTGTAIFLSSDPDQPETRVSLLGQGLYPSLSLGPDPYDLGERSRACDAVRGELTLKNEGEGTANVSGITVLGGAFSVAEPSEFPFALEPGEEIPVIVESVVDADGEWSGTVYVQSDDPAGDRTASVSLVIGSWATTDRFVQGAWAETDVLLTVDRSCSMEDDAARLSTELPQFLDALEEIGTDFQLAVVTSDDGCHNETLFTLETEDADAKFYDAVFGPAGTYTEAGFRLARAALSKSEAGGCNEGFLREGARMSILHLSDEPEQSTLSAEEYLDIVAGYSGYGVVSAVAGPVPGGCETAEAGTGYDEAAELSGGFFTNFCTVDWEEVAANLAILSLGVEITDTFALSEIPWEDTLVVEVDGYPTEAWTYEAETNGVRMDEEPEEGAQIVITYEYGVCDDTAGG